MKSFKKGRLSDTQIFEWLKELRKNAYIPESGFSVSAIFRVGTYGESDYYFAGVNVENIDHRLSTHGEEGAISAMVTALGKGAEILEGWVMGVPKDDKTSESLVSCCGKCRQQIAGFAEENVKVHSVALSGNKSTTTVGEFLPDLFTFRQYIEELSLPINNSKKALSISAVESKLFRRGEILNKDIFEWLEELESIDYASNISQSIILKLSNGFYVSGTQVEEAAFISINAAQNAMAIFITEFGEQSIEEIWVYTKGRDGKEIPDDSFCSLSLSALQSLISMAQNENIPVNFFTGNGDVLSIPLTESAKILSTSNKRVHKKASWQNHS